MAAKTLASCIFCKIIKGDIPSFKLVETEKVFSFLDIGPLSKGHALIVPKYHAEKLHELPDDYLPDVLPAAKKIALALGAENYNLLQNNGRIAHQEVDHVHFHVIPKPAAGNAGGLVIGWPTQKPSMDDLKALHDELVKKLGVLATAPISHVYPSLRHAVSISSGTRIARAPLSSHEEFSMGLLMTAMMSRYWPPFRLALWPMRVARCRNKNGQKNTGTPLAAAIVHTPPVSSFIPIMIQEHESDKFEATMPVVFDVSVIPLKLRRSLKRMVDEFVEGSMDNHSAVARSRNGEDITVSSDRPSKGRHASRPSKDIHNIPTTEGADPSGGGALGRPAPRLPRGHAADFKKPPYREGGTLASQPDNKHHKSPAQEEREELAKVLVGMGLDGKLPLSRHEMPSFKKKSKTKAM